MKRALAKLVILSSAILMLAGLASAGPISGTINSRLTIMQDSWLTGNVVCKVNADSCIVFGASDISLELNGHTITGQGVRASCPTEVTNENAIHTGGRNNVEILGPGLIGEFREAGIVINGSNSLVRDIVVSSTCREGLFVDGSNNDIEHNTVVRSSLDSNNLASIFVTGVGGHTIRHNHVAGAGPVPLTSGGGEGIFIGGSPTGNNLIERNFVGGMPGVGIIVAAKGGPYLNTTGNKIIRNSVFGNVGNWDILDNNPAGSNTYKDNACEVSLGPDAPPCPNLPEPEHHHDDNGDNHDSGGNHESHH